MDLVQTASLLVAFCMLASAATAYAECAWVLWVGVQPSDAFVTVAECKTEAKKAEAKGWVARCLPDTVDPRGPKGK